jgi:exodeoxyribonuclease VII small subunit
LSKDAADPAAMSYEEALAELEKIVAQLERGDVPLADSIRFYKRGAALRARCVGQLMDALLVIDQIVMGPDGPRAEPARIGKLGNKRDMSDDPQSNARLPLVSIDDFL